MAAVRRLVDRRVEHLRPHAGAETRPTSFEIYGQWELGSAPHQHLAHSETRVVRIASVTQIAPGVRAWAVHRAGGGDIRGVDLVEIMDVTVVANSDLPQPRALQVLLDTKGTSQMARRRIPIVYKGIPLGTTFRVDLIVEDVVVVEPKSVAALLKVHEAQVLTYMKLIDCPAGLLINFTVPKLMDGVKRLLLPGR